MGGHIGKHHGSVRLIEIVLKLVTLAETPPSLNVNHAPGFAPHVSTAYSVSRACVAGT